MTKHIKKNLNRLFNPARLADATVLALSAIERGDKVPPELLRGGIELCDYLISLFEELEVPQLVEEQWAFHRARDKKVLQESGIDIKSMHVKVNNAKEWINGLIQNPSSYTQEQIKNIQELLVTVTMPMWRIRASEFRERKLKRGLIIHG
jgi:hypothetical protein